MVAVEHRDVIDRAQELHVFKRAHPAIMGEHFGFQIGVGNHIGFVAQDDGRHIRKQLDEAGYLRLAHIRRQRENEKIEVEIKLVAKLHFDKPVAAGQEFRLVVNHVFFRLPHLQCGVCAAPYRHTGRSVIPCSS